MKKRFENFDRLSREEQGVALITVIILTAVLMIIAAGTYVVASREQKMTQADFAGGQAFYYAEGGIENALDILNYAATETQLTRQRADQSLNGYGYLMDPTPAYRQDPTDPVEMKIGNDTYTVNMDTVDENGNSCTNCGLNLATSNSAYILITAEGQSVTGYRKLQQRVQVAASGYPLTFYITGDANLNGGPTMANESIYVRGSFYGREKLTVSGTDQMYGGSAGVRATGSIYAKANGGGSQIYTSSGGQSSYWDENYINDRDNRGPAGNKFSISELETIFGTAGLSASQLATLKAMAKTSGYYNDNPGGGVTIQQGDIPSHSGDIVIYVDFPSGIPNNNEVKMKFEWPHTPYTTGKVFIIVMNGSVTMTGSAIGASQGIVYCPDGEVRADGSGGGTFTGFVFGKGLTNIGNFNFTMTEAFLQDLPFFAWTVYRETAWTECDGAEGC